MQCPVIIQCVCISIVLEHYDSSGQYNYLFIYLLYISQLLYLRAVFIVYISVKTYLISRYYDIFVIIENCEIQLLKIIEITSTLNKCHCMFICLNIHFKDILFTSVTNFEPQLILHVRSLLSHSEQSETKFETFSKAPQHVQQLLL